MIPSRAAGAAGFAPGSGIYTTLEGNPEIQVRITELIELQREKDEMRRQAALASAQKVGELTGVSRAWVLQRLAENAQLAQDAGDFKNSNEALKMIGDEFGLFSGSSASEKDQAQSALANLDFDKLDTLLDRAPVAAIENTSRPMIDAEEAMSLIEGQGKAAERIRKSRRHIDTGSETDVALTRMDDELTADIEDAEYGVIADASTDTEETPNDE